MSHLTFPPPVCPSVTPIARGICEYAFGIFSNGACETYYTKCAYGEPEEFPCTPGLAYDERIHGCNWPDLLEYCVPEGGWRSLGVCAELLAWRSFFSFSLPSFISFFFPLFLIPFFLFYFCPVPFLFFYLSVVSYPSIQLYICLYVLINVISSIHLSHFVELRVK